MQVRPQKVTPSKPAVCPFCNSTKLSVKNSQLTDEGAMKREEEEKNVIEAQNRARKNSEVSNCSTAEVDAYDSERKMSAEELQMYKSNNMSSNSVGSSEPSTPKLTKTELNGFGSSLERDLKIRRRALSDMSSDCGSNGNLNSPKLYKDDVVPVYASAEERRKLEEEMRKQVSHSLVRQMAEDSTVASASLPQVGGSMSRASRSGMRRRFGRGQERERDWNEIVEAFEQEGGEIQSLDDLVVLEAAIILSMEEQARQQRGEGADNNGNDDGNSSGEDGAVSLSNNDTRIASNLLRSGLPVLGDYVRRRIPESDEDDDNDDEYRRIASRRGLSGRMRFRSSGRTNRDGYSMGGLTEDEQMAMAIALSLRDAEIRRTDNTNDESDSGGNAAEGQNENENESNGFANGTSGTGNGSSSVISADEGEASVEEA